MRISATFQVPRVNLARFREAIHERLSEALVQGAFTWLATVVEESTSVGLPIWSAASIATFLPLARYVGMSLGSSPVAGAPDRTGLGIANGQATFDPGETTPGLYVFSYSTTLPHLIVNEYYNANTFLNPKTGEPYFHLHHPGPYRFQEKGEAAFLRFAGGVELPGWSSILDTVTLRVG
jgi:hypothetical protein